MKRRYIRVRYERAPIPYGRFIDLDSGRNLAAEIPAGYFDLFWNAQPGTRIRASIYRLPVRLKRRRRGRPEIATQRVVFKVVDVVALSHEWERP